MKAFPKTREYNISDGSEGMDLRDYFAAKAMQAFMTCHGCTEEEWGAKVSYRVADAMMKAREQ